MVIAHCLAEAIFRFLHGVRFSARRGRLLSSLFSLVFLLGRFGPVLLGIAALALVPSLGGCMYLLVLGHLHGGEGTLLLVIMGFLSILNNMAC